MVLYGEYKKPLPGLISALPLPGLISAFIAKLLLKKGCKGYLAHVIDTQVNTLMLEDGPVVKDFPDEFPEELSRLP